MAKFGFLRDVVLALTTPMSNVLRPYESSFPDASEARDMVVAVWRLGVCDLVAFARLPVLPSLPFAPAFPPPGKVLLVLGLLSRPLPMSRSEVEELVMLLSRPKLLCRVGSNWEANEALGTWEEPLRTIVGRVLEKRKQSVNNTTGIISCY